MNKTIKLTINDIVRGCCKELQVMEPNLMEDDSRRATEHRYMAFKLLEQAGYTHQQIADHFKMRRETITKGIGKLEDWLPIYGGMQGTFSRLKIIVLQ